jgi:hypothetical protein
VNEKLNQRLESKKLNREEKMNEKKESETDLRKIYFLGKMQREKEKEN